MWFHGKGCSTDRSQSICGLSCRSPVAGDMVSLCGRRGSRVTTKPAHRPKEFRHERQPNQICGHKEIAEMMKPSFSQRHGPQKHINRSLRPSSKTKTSRNLLGNTSLKHSSTVDASLIWTSLWTLHARLLTKANHEAEVQERPLRLAFN